MQARLVSQADRQHGDIEYGEKRICHARADTGFSESERIVLTDAGRELTEITVDNLRKAEEKAYAYCRRAGNVSRDDKTSHRFAEKRNIKAMTQRNF